MLTPLLGFSGITLDRRGDTQRAQQRCGGLTRMPGLAQRGVQAHVDKVMEHHIDDCPRAVSLRLRSVGIRHGNLLGRQRHETARRLLPTSRFETTRDSAASYCRATERTGSAPPAGVAWIRACSAT